MRLILFMITLLAVNVPQAKALTEINATSTTINNVKSNYYNELEASLQFNSINNGTQFLALAGQMNVWSNLDLGLRVQLPIDYSSVIQIYSSQFYSRFSIIKAQGEPYLELGLGGSYVSAEEESKFIGQLSLGAGYKYHFNPQFNLGLAAGVDMSDTRVKEDQIIANGNSVIYNRIALTTGYMF